MSYPYRDGLSGPEAAANAIRIIEADIGAKNVAAILIEPVQGEGGFVVPADGFLPALSAWTTANGVVFIADEIQSGFCRTGDWFAWTTKASYLTSSRPRRDSQEACRSPA